MHNSEYRRGEELVQENCRISVCKLAHHTGMPVMCVRRTLRKVNMHPCRAMRLFLLLVTRVRALGNIRRISKFLEKPY